MARQNVPCDRLQNLMAGTANPASQPIFVADIGGSFIKFGLSERQGHLREIERVPTPVHDWDVFVAALADLVQKHDDGRACLPLSLSVAAMIDPEDGRAFSANIGCLSDHYLERELSARLGCAVNAANDADCLTVAEAVEGAGKGHRIVFCAIFGTGVGGGMVVDGKLLRGTGGVTGEWGHGAISSTQVELAGEGMVVIPRFACGCGRTGCIDAVGSARGLEKLDMHLNGRMCNSHVIVEAWLAGEKAAGRTICTWLQIVADALATVINIVGASIVPTSGGLASVTQLMQKLDEAVRQRTVHRRVVPLVIPGHFSEIGGLKGAAILGRQAG